MPVARTGPGNLLALVIAALAFALAPACISEAPPLPECQVQCGPDGLCPDDAVCRDDGMCHAADDDNAARCDQLATPDGAAAGCDAGNPDAPDDFLVLTDARP